MTNYESGSYGFKNLKTKMNSEYFKHQEDKITRNSLKIKKSKPGDIYCITRNDKCKSCYIIIIEKLKLEIPTKVSQFNYCYKIIDPEMGLIKSRLSNFSSKKIFSNGIDIKDIFFDIRGSGFQLRKIKDINEKAKVLLLLGG